VPESPKALKGRSVALGSSFEAIWNRTVDANLGYLRAVSGLVAGHADAVSAVARRSLSRQPPAREVTPPRGGGDNPTLVLEGLTATAGAFVVENGLEHRIEAVVVASPFVTRAGSETRPATAFEPAMVKLEPGEQTIVRALVGLDDSFAPDTDYLGHFAVEGVPGTIIPVRVRRLGSP
jgi:hypothetical protein